MKPKDVRKFLRDLARTSNDQITIDFFDDSNFNIFYLKVVPSKGLYAHASFRFKIDMNVLEDTNHPDVTCITSIYHPNIDPNLGTNVCINLFNSWNKNTSLTDLTNAILYLFYEPNFSDPIYDIFVPPDFNSYSRLVRASLMGCRIGSYNYEANPDWIDWCKKNKPEYLEKIDPLEITDPLVNKVDQFDDQSKEDTTQFDVDNKTDKIVSLCRSDSRCSEFYTNLVNPHQTSTISERTYSESNLSTESCTLYVDIPMEKIFINWIAQDKLNDETNQRSIYYFVLAYEFSDLSESFKDRLFIPIDTETNILKTIQTGSHVEWPIKCKRDCLAEEWGTLSGSHSDDESEMGHLEIKEKSDMNLDQYEDYHDHCIVDQLESDKEDDDDDDVDEWTSKNSELQMADSTLRLLKNNVKPFHWFFYQTYFLPQLIPGSVVSFSRARELRLISSSFYRNFCYDLERILKPCSTTKSKVKHILLADCTAVWPTSPNIMHLNYQPEKSNSNNESNGSNKIDHRWRVIEWISPVNSYKKNDQVDHLRLKNLTAVSLLVNFTNFFSWLHRLEIQRVHGILWSEERKALQSIFVRGNLGIFFTNLDIWPLFLVKETSKMFTRAFFRLFCHPVSGNARVEFSMINTAVNSHQFQRFA